jgi:hypothetical protein
MGGGTIIDVYPVSTTTENFFTFIGSNQNKVYVANPWDPATSAGGRRHDLDIVLTAGVYPVKLRVVPDTTKLAVLLPTQITFRDFTDHTWQQIYNQDEADHDYKSIFEDTHLGMYIVCDNFVGATPNKMFHRYDYLTNSIVTSEVNNEAKDPRTGLVIDSTNVFIAIYASGNNGFTVHDRTNLLQ